MVGRRPKRELRLPEQRELAAAERMAEETTTSSWTDDSSNCVCRRTDAPEMTPVSYLNR